MTPDTELLRQYATEGDEAAFAEVVRRQVNLVYAVAIRVTSGNTTLAEDVTQSVFADLARKAGPLSHHPALAGWLHTSARFTALKAIRGEQRRHAREQEVAIMQDYANAGEIDWEQLRPVLDEAVGRLREKERAAIVLRFFQGLSHREVGESLGLNENTARKRVDHALEKLRAHFARTGITVSSALLVATLTTHAQEVAPAGLAEKITKPSLVSITGGGVLASFFWQIFLMSKTSKTLLAVAILVTVFIALPAIFWPKASDSPAKKTENTAAKPPTPTVEQPVVPAGPSSKPASPVAAKPSVATGSSLAPIPDPHDNLDSALADIARIIRSGDALGAQEAYLPPEILAKMSPQTLESRKKTAAAMALHPNPASTQYAEELAQAMESLRGQKPVYNAAGDEATYTFTIVSTLYSDLAKKADIPAEDAAMLASLAEAQAKPKTLVMVKINDKWYAKSGL